MSSPRAEALERRRTAQRSKPQANGGRTEAPEATSLPLRLPRSMRIAKRKHGLRSASMFQCFNVSMQKMIPLSSLPLYIYLYN